MEQQQPILMYNSTTRRWEGKDSSLGFALWMDDATFQRYAWKYLDEQQIYQPTLGDLDKARDHCRPLSYWQGRRDPRIHFTSI